MFHDVMGLERALPWLSLAFACGYLAGAVPMGVLVARAFGLGDLRKVGSGNIGATNVLRTGAKGAAALTLLLDALKGWAPAALFLGWGDLAAQAAGVGAVLGHCFPVWLRFRGGKGVATAWGVLLALHWPSGLLALGAWLGAVALSRISSVGALAATLAAPAALVAFDRWEAVLAALLIGALVWLRHAANIGRLVAGTEPRVGAKAGRGDGRKD